MLFSHCLCFCLFLVCILGRFQNTVTAYPTGAGTCHSGPAVLNPTSPHRESDGKGNLTDGNYTTSFVNGTYLLEAVGSKNFFKGFLLRLSSNDTSADGAIELIHEYSTLSQLMKSTGEEVGSFGTLATCATDVAGVTHTDKSKKTLIGVNLSLRHGSNYTMMITVVKNEHEWYYSEEALAHDEAN